MLLFIRFKLLPQLFLTVLSKSCFKSQRLPSGMLFPMYCVTMQDSWSSDHVTTVHSKQGLLWGMATFPHRNDICLWMSLVPTSKSGLGHPPQPINQGAHFCKINAFGENKDYTKISIKSSKVNQINRVKFAIRNLHFCREILGQPQIEKCLIFVFFSLVGNRPSGLVVLYSSLQSRTQRNTQKYVCKYLSINLKRLLLRRQTETRLSALYELNIYELGHKPFHSLVSDAVLKVTLMNETGI